MSVIDLLKRLLQFKSITPDDDGALEFIKEYLGDFESIEIEKEGVKNLFLYKKFSDGNHLCFAGHVDVVPPGDGWSSDAFSPLLKSDYIYARGTQDMKSGLSAFLKAIKDTKKFKGTLSILLTSDEEGDAKYGTLEVLKLLQKRDFLPDFAIVAEPTCEKVFGDAIKIGRRGSINGVIEKLGVQSHAAYPEKGVNPIHQIANILPNIAGVDLDSGDKHFAPSKFVITDIRAGHEVTNVTPGKLKMMFNVRNSTNTTKDDVKRFVDRYFKDMDYTLILDQSSKPFLTNQTSKVVQNLTKAIKYITDISPKLSTAGGTSDARFFGEFGIDTVEFGVINDTIHAANERVSIKEVEDLKRVFKEVIDRWD